MRCPKCKKEDMLQLWEGTTEMFVRKATGFRAADVSELLGVRPETLSRWERGEAEIPRAAVFVVSQLLLARSRRGRRSRRWRSRRRGRELDAGWLVTAAH